MLRTHVNVCDKTFIIGDGGDSVRRNLGDGSAFAFSSLFV